MNPLVAIRQFDQSLWLDFISRPILIDGKLQRRISDEALLVHVKAIHAEVKGEYGWPRMWKELLARGTRVGKERVRRLMQRHGIKARGKRK